MRSPCTATRGVAPTREKHSQQRRSRTAKNKQNSGRRCWHPTPVFLPGKSHGRRSLVGCSPWGHWGSDTTKRLHFDFSHSCIGEGNGNLLQCSCLENPRDAGAWWAAVYGVAQSRTWLKQLSSKAYIWNLEKRSEEFIYRAAMKNRQKNKLMDTGRGEERVRCMERVTWKLTLPCIK